jgi:hypothetical protein
VYPRPLTSPALTVTGVVPVELSVTDPLPVFPTATIPKLTLVPLSTRVGTDVPRLMEYVFVAPPEVAVRVAVPAVLTADTVARKLAVAEPAATVTDDGMDTAVALLVRLTVWPPVPATAFRVTVHASVPEPAIEVLVQLNALKVGSLEPPELPDD